MAVGARRCCLCVLEACALHDADGDLVGVQLNGAPLAAYGYDEAGRRIARAVTGSPGVAGEYLYFPDGRLMAEADGTGAIIREYLWLEDLPLAATDISGGGTTLYYIHASHRGEPIAMTNSAKAKVWDASYAPFGAATVFTAATPLDLRLPGQQLQCRLKYRLLLESLAQQMKRAFDARPERTEERRVFQNFTGAVLEIVF